MMNSNRGPFLKFFSQKKMVKLSETAKRYIKRDLKGLRDLSLHDMLTKRESLKKRRNISAADKEVLNDILTRAIDRRVERLVMNHPDEEGAHGRPVALSD